MSVRHFNSGSPSGQAKSTADPVFVGPEFVALPNGRLEARGGGSIWGSRRLEVGFLEVLEWDRKAKTRDGVRLRDVLSFYRRGVPEPVRTRYGLEDDFRRLQAWRGRMSGLWRRFSTAGRDAEIRRLRGLGNTFRAIAGLYGLSVGAVHYIVHREVGRFPSERGQPSVRVVPRKPANESRLSLRERLLSVRSGLLNTPRSWLRIVENMMRSDMKNGHWRPPDPARKGQFERIQGMLS